MKRLCVLQVAPESPNQDHVNFFKNKQDCDFYFVTHDSDHQDGLKFCPNTTWAETRNTLIELVPKEYDYYAFIDYDYILRPQGDLPVLEQIVQDLELNPAVLTYYPGKNLITPYATDFEYFKSKKYSIIPFTHMGLKIVHRSLLQWFFPLCTKFSIDIDASHMFNIQEIPFIKNVVCSHNMIYDNGYSDENAEYNKDGAYSKYKLDEMWKWIRPSFKLNGLLSRYISNQNEYDDSMLVKRAFIDIMRNTNITPTKQSSEVDYLSDNWDKIEQVFDLNHEFFMNKKKVFANQFLKLEGDFLQTVETLLKKYVSFSRLKQKENPWHDINKDINNNLENFRKISINECVDIYQKLENNKELFIYSSGLNEELKKFLEGKRVAIVGPAPYLLGKKKGKIIDEYDVVVRIQPGIANIEDYGSRTDIIQSCLNSSYSPIVKRYIEQTPNNKKPKFIISNDTVAREIVPGSNQWLSVVDEYEEHLKHLGVPLAHLRNKDLSWDRWALYWEMYPKEHIEKIEAGKYTMYTENFNSGYGSLCMLLSYPVKELGVFGVNFYNFGVAKELKDKYNPEYTDTQGGDGTYLGPDHLLHDQMSQILHCINVLEKDPRFKMDAEIKESFYKENLQKRLEKFKKLPKFRDNTQ